MTDNERLAILETEIKNIKDVTKDTNDTLKAFIEKVEVHYATTKDLDALKVEVQMMAKNNRKNLFLSNTLVLIVTFIITFLLDEFLHGLVK